MKKVLVLVLALVLTLSVVALAACSKGEVYYGAVSYNSWGVDYGCVVAVTVDGDTITNVELLDVGGLRRTSPDNAAYGWDRYDETEAAYEDYLSTFVGKTVAEVNAIEASATAAGQSVTTEGWKIDGSTQSSARIICAIQNALSKIAD